MSELEKYHPDLLNDDQFRASIELSVYEELYSKAVKLEEKVKRLSDRGIEDMKHTIAEQEAEIEKLKDRGIY